MLLDQPSYETRSDFAVGPANGPAWAAPGLRAIPADMIRLTIGHRASQEFARMTNDLRTACLDGKAHRATPEADPSGWLERSLAALRRVDPELVRALRAGASRACPLIVVRGMPTDLIAPPTPYDGRVDPAASFQAIVNLHAVLASLDLYPVAYAGEASSTLHAVCPVRHAQGQLSSHGFDAVLPFHTDYADRPIDEPVGDRSPAAAALAFAVERADPAVPMQFVAARRLLSRLTAEQIAVGCSEEFVVAPPDIFRDRLPPRVRRLFLREPGRGFRCRLNLGKMTGETPRAARLLHEIRDILSEAPEVEKLHVRRGDIVIMDNQRGLHRRAAFTPRWDGTDRYFIRISAVSDPRAGLAADPLRPWVWA